MKRLSWSLIASVPFLVILLAGLSDPAGGSTAVSRSSVITDTIPAEIYSGRRPRYGILGFDFKGVFGPHICTDYGDPFSPTLDPDGANFRQNWRDDPNDRTYHYQIQIPADYPDDVVRVELFDPDSINKPNNNGNNHIETVAHTAIAIANGMPAVESLSCNQQQKNPCLINTGEDNLGLDPDLVNLWWFARVDENRGGGSTSNTGNGTCAEPSDYTVAFNTITRYELFYYQELSNGTVVLAPLATYYGQSGDYVFTRNGFARDRTFSSIANHDTDLRWVTPGGQSSYDQPVPVPTACGSANGGDYDPINCPSGTPPGPGRGFEVNVFEDMIDAVTDEDGNIMLYVDVTTLSGASENGYEIWAGPNNYVVSVPSNVNARQVSMLNNPSVHHSQGIETAALGDKLVNSTSDFRIDIPVGYIGPEYAGQSVYVSMFDSDSGASPPIDFYFDTISRSDYELSFSFPPFPDGETGRCIIGGCNNQFVNPPYRIDIPTLTDACTDPNDPAQMLVCNPFYGGRLMASYDGGLNDTYLWHMRLPEPPPGDPTQGCTAFPITIEQGVHTVTQSAYDSTIYPTFTYPTGANRPTWNEFIEQPPAGTTVPLLGGIEGMVFVLDYNTLTPQSFDFLKWNSHITNLSSGNILATSLTYPGNSHDYADHNDLPAAPPPDWPHTYRGYAEVGDPTDKEMHLADFILRDTVSGGFGGFGVTAALNDHINEERTLRLPLWDHSSGGSGPNQYQASGFGLFRILGYSTNDWLLVQLVGLDESCGQPSTAVTSAAIEGPAEGRVNVSYPFTATVAPATAGQPITYVWETAGQTPITHTGGLTDTAAFTWPTPGQKTLTLTADNDQGPPVVVTYTLEIVVPVNSAAIEGPEEGLIQSSYTFTGTAGPLTATLPLTYVWETAGQPPIIHTGSTSDTAAFTWPTPGQKTITLTVSNIAEPPVITTHAIQINVPIGSAAIEGPVEGIIQTSYTFTATANPINATLPITYMWETAGQPPIIHTGGLTDTAAFTWTTPGEKTLVLTAVNIADEPVVVTHTIQLNVPAAGAVIDGPDQGYIQTSYTFTATTLPLTATLPVTYVWETAGQEPITHTGGLTDTAVFNWDTLGEKSITLTVTNGLGPPVVVLFTIEIETRVWIPAVVKE